MTFRAFKIKGTIEEIDLNTQDIKQIVESKGEDKILIIDKHKNKIEVKILWNQKLNIFGKLNNNS